MLCYGQASSRPPAHSAWMGTDNPAPSSPGSYLVLPVSGSTTLRMTLCLASHSSFVIGFIAWIRDFCSSVRTGMQWSVRAVLVGLAPGQGHSTTAAAHGQPRRCLGFGDKPRKGRDTSHPKARTSFARMLLLTVSFHLASLFPTHLLVHATERDQHNSCVHRLLQEGKTIITWPRVHH